MGVNVADITSPLGSKLITITPCNATASNNIMSGATTVQIIEVDNTANANQINYVKILNGNGSGNSNVVTVSTDAPNHILAAPAGIKRTFVFPECIAFTKLNVWCVQEAGTAGTSSPSSSVKVEILVS